MPRKVLACKDVECHLRIFESKSSPTIGVIIGQTCQGKERIVHVTATTMQQSSLPMKNISGDLKISIIEHSIQATRMLPGGMYVIGVFLVCQTILSEEFRNNIKSLLKEISVTLSQDYLYDNPESKERIFLYLSSDSKHPKCDLYNIITDQVEAVELRFDDGIYWMRLNCKFELMENYNILGNIGKTELKKQLQVVLESVETLLRSSIIIFNGSYRDSNELLFKNSPNMEHNINDKPVQVSILSECNCKLSKIEFDKTQTLDIKGVIFSSVYLNPLATFKTAKQGVIEDILRSLATRLEMHWDSLTEEETEVRNSIHELPRRVMLPVSACNLSVSDYLFPGENIDEAKNSVEQILGAKTDIWSKNMIEDLEGPLLFDKRYQRELPTILKSSTFNKTIIGLFLALVVLISSMVLKYCID